MLFLSLSHSLDTNFLVRPPAKEELGTIYLIRIYLQLISLHLLKWQKKVIFNNLNFEWVINVEGIPYCCIILKTQRPIGLQEPTRWVYSTGASPFESQVRNSHLNTIWSSWVLLQTSLFNSWKLETEVTINKEKCICTPFPFAGKFIEFLCLVTSFCVPVDSCRMNSLTVWGSGNRDTWGSMTVRLWSKQYKIVNAKI